MLRSCTFAAQSSRRSRSGLGRGRWTHEEHRRFLHGTSHACHLCSRPLGPRGTDSGTVRSHWLMCITHVHNGCVQGCRCMDVHGRRSPNMWSRHVAQSRSAFTHRSTSPSTRARRQGERVRYMLTPDLHKLLTTVRDELKSCAPCLLLQQHKTGTGRTRSMRSSSCFTRCMAR